MSIHWRVRLTTFPPTQSLSHHHPTTISKTPMHIHTSHQRVLIQGPRLSQKPTPEDFGIWVLRKKCPSTGFPIRQLYTLDTSRVLLPWQRETETDTKGKIQTQKMFYLKTRHYHWDDWSNFLMCTYNNMICIYVKLCCSKVVWNISTLESLYLKLLNVAWTDCYNNAS